MSVVPLRKRALLAGALVTALAAAMLPAASSTAATPPPPASQLTVVKRADHQLAIQFAVPAAFYHPGAGSVVRLTRGRTPAATPTAGYAVPTDAKHVATTNLPPPLGADLDYTFAVWIRDNGVYSKRATIIARTLKDTTPPGVIGNLSARAGIGDGRGRVVLSWTEDRSDDIDYVRIVRNTRPTTTEGTVVNVAPGTQAYSDTDLPDSVYSYGAGFSAAPLYYYVIQRDKAGHFSARYAGTSVVVGSRTISGTYQGTNRFISLWGAPYSTGESRAFTGESGDELTDGTFSFLAPPGVYTVCDTSNTGDTAGSSCWKVDPDGSAGPTPWSGEYTEDVAYPSIDVTAGSYDKVRFTGTS